MSSTGSLTIPCLTDEQVSRIMLHARMYGKHADRPRWTAIFSLLANYGPRVSEVLMLKWSQVDFDRQTITLPTLKRRKPMTRTLPLFPEVGTVLQAYQATVNGDPRMFPMTKHARGVVWQAFQTICRRAGVPPIKTHALRHSAATRMVKVDLVMARDVLGHASVATTDRYLHALRLAEQFRQVQAFS